MNKVLNKDDLSGLFELVDSSGALLETSVNGTILYVNEKFCKMMGYSENEFLGKNPRMMKSGIHSEEFFKNLWETILSGQVWHDEICNKKKDGSLIWLETYIGPIFDENRKVIRFVLVRFDVTHQHEIKQLKSDQEAQLASSSKMAALGEMAAGIAHEINSPLSVILGKATNLLKQLKSPTIDFEKFNIDLEKIQTTTLRIARVIEGLRRFSRSGDNDSLLPVSVSGIIEDAMALCSEKFRNHSIDLKINLSKDFSVQVNGRFTQLAQVLLNLLNNAYDAIETLPEKWVEISVNCEGDFAVIRVTDSGYGIPPEVEKKLMQSFFTTKIAGKGTGLGLSISKGIIANHHGKFYYNNQSKRTQFVIELPLIKDQLSKE